MPELPEVETIRLQVSQYLPLIVTREIFSEFYKSIVKNKQFAMTGKTILSISRKGKMLNFKISDDFNILSQLGMSGSWQISQEPIVKKHAHIIFETLNLKNQKMYLAYVDPRRFGNMHFLLLENTIPFLERLGIDISSDEFTAKYLFETFQKFSNKELKPFLLDQKYFAGCGNYIASEACARAKIMPNRNCGSITKKECRSFVVSIKKILDMSQKSNGLTFSGGYVDAFGNKGEALSSLVVFHQEICGMCKKKSIKKIIQQQRSTFYCDHCQK